MKKSFYVTFGQRSPFRAGWVEIIASGMEEAMAEAHSLFGQHYSNVYEARHFDSTSEETRDLYPDGQLGRTMEGL